ncbi:amidohydrolase family protein [Streptomyces sp. KS 21]|uniref:amidohydrolase family protein n=1 Tax=Streptomyces sp. KS 21 TaxID=2485150 RepID=UPI00326494BE
MRQGRTPDRPPDRARRDGPRGSPRPQALVRRAAQPPHRPARRHGRHRPHRRPRHGPGRRRRTGPARRRRVRPIAHHDARRVLAIARSPLGAAAAGPALTGLTALEGMTSHAALAAGEQQVAGRIAAGCRADLTAFALDPVDTAPDELAEAPIRLTMSGGRITHSP